jgi:hypothetical protein
MSYPNMEFLLVLKHQFGKIALDPNFSKTMNAEKLFNDIFVLSNYHTNNAFQFGYFSSPV